MKLFNKTYQVNALVYNKAPVDLLLGRSFPDFKQVLQKAEGLQDIFPVTTRRQHASSEAEDRALKKKQETGYEPQPLIELLGEDYDFEQTNHSVRPEQNSDLATQTDRDKLEKDQKDDPTLTDLWQQIYGNKLMVLKIVNTLLYQVFSTSKPEIKTNNHTRR